MHSREPVNTSFGNIDHDAPKLKANILEDEHSFVRLVGHLGDDLTVVNSARVSYGKESVQLTEKDIQLIRYLAEHNHTSPFRHVQLQFHVSAPEFVARQWYKHVVGAGFTDHAWNEISGRYTEYEPKFFIPKEFRVQDKKNKQSSAEPLVGSSAPLAHTYYKYAINQSYDLYKGLMTVGVCREQARAVLPLALYTEYYWTVSLQALVNFIKLRTHQGAQLEIQKYAQAVLELALEVAPLSVDALVSCK